MRKSIIVDIDGTIADISHRLHHIDGKQDVETVGESKKADWDAFHAECHLDTPIEATCELVRTLGWEDDWAIIMITGRDSKNRPATENWLRDNQIPYDLLLMRARGDHSPDIEIKRKWLHMLRTGQLTLPDVLTPQIVLEDRTRVVEMWREEGLIALQCATGDF